MSARVFVPAKEVNRFTCASGVPGLRALLTGVPRVSEEWQKDATAREVKRHTPRLHAAYVALGRYIQREEHFDFPLYDVKALTDDPDRAVYLWLARQPCCGAYEVLGSASFERDFYPNLPRVWVMSWIWIFPEHRRHGLLSRAWPVFTKHYGPMVVQPPISEGLKRFLERRPSCLITTTETDKEPITGKAYTKGRPVRVEKGPSSTALHTQSHTLDAIT